MRKNNAVDDDGDVEPQNTTKRKGARNSIALLNTVTSALLPISCIRLT
jgi:hypothetical protein